MSNEITDNIELNNRKNIEFNIVNKQMIERFNEWFSKNLKLTDIND